VSPPAIAARAVEKRFGRTTALRSVDLEVAAGSSLSVLGPNGAGKSTLLRLMAGLARPSAGSIEVAGQAAASRASRGCIGYIGHATLLYPNLTARENLTFAARLYGVANPGARADLLLEEEGLTHAAHRAAGGFSRGMAQRLAIARGLVHDPELLLLDEPFTGLDRHSADRLAERLQTLHAGGRTIVLVTHDIERAVQATDTVVVLSAGRVALSMRCDAGHANEIERAYLAAAEASR
jgi:heme exporter protein A